MTTEEKAKWADEAVREKRRIRVIDLNSKKKNFMAIPFFATAKEDIAARQVLVGSELNGTEDGTFKARKEKIYAIAKQEFLRPETSEKNQDDEISATIAINHLMVLDLNNDKDAALFYLLVADHDNFASSSFDVNPQTHRFYFEDKRRESANKRQAVKTKLDVIEKIQKLTPEEIPAVFRMALGYKPDNLSVEDMQAELDVFADEHPEIIRKMIMDPKFEAKIFANHLLNADIIKYQRYTGSYYDQDNKIGSSMDQVIDYITAPENSKLKDAWGRKLKLGSNKSGNVQEPAGSTAKA